MSDVLIINSPLFREVNEKYDEDSLPPIGLGYIATNLRDRGMSVELVDAVDQRLALKDLIGIIHSLSPKVLAVNIFTTNYELVRELVKTVSRPTLHVIIGGLSTRELYKRIFQWDVNCKVDIVAGDGELITFDLIQSSVHEEPAETAGNFRYFQVFNNSTYFLSEEQISNVKLDRSFFHNEPVPHPLGFDEANIITSRGCVYNCAFCAAARSLNRNFEDRERSVDSVVNEILEIKRLYPSVRSIRVLDDLFLKTDKCVSRAIEVFSRAKIQWRSMAHIQTFRNVSEDTLRELAKAGCNELFIGIESGSPSILKMINKTSDVNVIKQRLDSLFRAGINVKGYFIYGFPDETIEDMQQTFELASYLVDSAKKAGVQFRTSPFQFRPYHGTELYNKLVAEGKYHDDHNAISVAHSLSDKIGRQQFNFHSGNYSKVDTKTLYDYICRTAELNPKGLFDKERIKDSNLHI